MSKKTQRLTVVVLDNKVHSILADTEDGGGIDIPYKELKKAIKKSLRLYGEVGEQKYIETQIAALRANEKEIKKNKEESQKFDGKIEELIKNFEQDLEKNLGIGTKISETEVKPEAGLDFDKDGLIELDKFSKMLQDLEDRKKVQEEEILKKNSNVNNLTQDKSGNNYLNDLLKSRTVNPFSVEAVNAWLKQTGQPPLDESKVMFTDALSAILNKLGVKVSIS